jgi:class 3 adenylate cyclase
MAGTVTLMFTDLVGSTELLGRLGEDGAATLRRRHFAALREAIAAADGREVKSLGDGLMVAFDSAADAVACARDIQRRATVGDDPLGVRVGLHAGEPDREEEDYFGTPVVVASRLCDRAQAGQILASDLVRGLAGPREGGAFRSLGALTLKGLAEPVTAWDVHWGDDGERAPAPAAGDLRPAVPGALARGDGGFVGREDALRRLAEELASAREAGMRMAMLSGEPGIGKSRLAAEAAHAAHGEGAVVLFGRCDEEALIPYQPFAEAVRGYLHAVPAAVPLATGLERLTGAVTAAPSRDADPTAERMMLFEAVASFLTAVSRAGPLLLILDDLHWADGPTLALLRHVVRRGSEIPALVLGTYRDTDLSRAHPLAATLGELRRERAVQRLSLSGLAEPEVAGLLTSAAGHEPPGAFVRALHGETEGNPFFIEEIVRHLVESGAIVQRDGRWTSDRPIEAMGIPEGVREAVGRRLAHLTDTANRALADASALGRRFEFSVLAAMSGVDEDPLLDALDEALQAQLVVEASEGGRPAYAFRHALVRETLYEELSLPRRQRLHLRAAEAIESVHARDLDPHAGTLAMHLQQAGAAVDPRRALEWTLRAAAASAAQLAWEDAAAQLEAALELMDEAGARPEERAPLLERMADLRYVTNVDLEGGISFLEQALSEYEAAGLTDRAARVHSRLGRDRVTYWGPTMDIRRGLEHIAAAEGVLGRDPGSPAVGALNLAEATAALALADGPRARAASTRALEIGRARDRPLLVLNAEILDSFLAAGQGEPDGSRRLDRAWEEADRRNHPWLAFLATWLAGALAYWEGGPVAQAACQDRELAGPRSASSFGQRRILGNFRAQPEALGGRLDDAAAMIAEHPLPEFLASTAAFTILRVGPVPGEEMARRMVADGERSGNKWTAMLASVWVAEAQVGRQDFAGAVASEEAAVATLADGGFDAFADYERARLVARYVQAGRLDAARSTLAVARPRLGDRTGLGAAFLTLGEAAVAAAEGRPEAETWFPLAAERMEAIGNLWGACEARRLWGVMLSRPEPLETAIEAYERMGAAQAWIDLARRERASLSGA